SARHVVFSVPLNRSLWLALGLSFALVLGALGAPQRQRAIAAEVRNRFIGPFWIALIPGGHAYGQRFPIEDRVFRGELRKLEVLAAHRLGAAPLFLNQLFGVFGRDWGQASQDIDARLCWRPVILVREIPRVEPQRVERAAHAHGLLTMRRRRGRILDYPM